MINYKDITRLDLETSSLCNAECPSCSRRACGGLKNTVFTETFMTLQQIKDWFPVDFIKQLNTITMCGNYGDSMTNPELIPILQYFKSINPTIQFYMNTNASGRDAQFWLDLGEIFKDKGTVVFSVDGLEDTNWIYRKGTHWDKIINAMTNYISTGAKARWEFLVFRHNQHQIEEARELSKQLGFKEFYAKKAMGFVNFTDKNGNHEHNMRVYGTEGQFQYTIKPLVDMKVISEDYWINNRNAGKVDQQNRSEETPNLESGYLKDIKLQLEQSVIPIEEIKWHKSSNQDLTVDKTRELTEHEKQLGKYDIECEAMAESKIFINSYGLVFPCCYIASIYDDEFGAGDMVVPVREFINKYKEESISLQHTSLKDIIDGDIYTTGWIESFEDRDIRNKRLKACSIFCGRESPLLKTFESTKKENNLI